MLLIVYYGDFIPSKELLAHKYFEFVLGCLVLNSCLSVSHIHERFNSFKNKNFKFLERANIELDELQTILKNSKQIRYLKIYNVNGINKLKNDELSSEL